MLTSTELKSLLQEQGLRLTKRLGQHHLIDARIIERIVERCALSKGETVVEIGPGLGALTEPLADRAGQVIAVEVDPRIAALLGKRLMGRRNVEIRCKDILEVAWEPFGEVVVVGAIPYQITSPILVALSEARRWVTRAILIVQEEVAGRLIASPGTKAYGRLSVLGQYSWGIERLLRVPRSAFFPQPEVDSTCLRLVRSAQQPVTPEDEQRFFAVVRAAFSQRRKTLANCLSGLDGIGSRGHVERMLAMLQLPGDIRGEELSLMQFGALTQLLEAHQQDKK